MLRTKECLAAVRASDGALALTTMLFHDELRPTEPVPNGGKKPTPKQLEHAVALIEGLSTDWDPERYEDCYRERLRRVIEDKRKRRKIEAPEPVDEPAPAPDLLEALQRTLDNLRADRSSPAEPEGDGDDLDALSREELYERAQSKGISGRTKMSKEELIEALGDELMRRPLGRPSPSRPRESTRGSAATRASREAAATSSGTAASCTPRTNRSRWPSGAKKSS